MGYDLEKLRQQFTNQTFNNPGAGAGINGTIQHERAYGAVLNRDYVVPVQDDIVATLSPVIESNAVQLSSNNHVFLLNARQDVIDLVNASMKELQVDWQARAIENAMKETAAQMVETENKFNKQRFIRNINKAIGVDITNILKDSGLQQLLLADIEKNFNLIKSMSQQQIENARQAMVNGIVNGQDTNQLFREIDKVQFKAKNHAKLIARDQISKVNNGLNHLRQKDIGITRYVWRTSLDERVRSSHQENNRKIFNWNSPPPDTGHPGDDVQCRCYADPYFKDLKF